MPRREHAQVAVGEDNPVGIARRDRHRGEPARQLAGGAHLGYPHLDLHLAEGRRLRLYGARTRTRIRLQHHPRARGARTSIGRDPQRRTAGSISAHLRDRAVGVVDHESIAVQQRQDPVRADSPMAIAQFRGALRRGRSPGQAAQIEQDEIVSQAVKLGEAHGGTQHNPVGKGAGGCLTAVQPGDSTGIPCPGPAPTATTPTTTTSSTARRTA